jgi:formylglycine-generating enzyme required for sulfatase activity
MNEPSVKKFWLLGAPVAIAIGFFAHLICEEFHKPASLSESDIVLLEKECPVQLKFIRIPPGKFLMGSPLFQQERKDDETQHPVVISQAFSLSETLVMQNDWMNVMGKNPAANKPQQIRDCVWWIKNMPVESVSWNDIQEFLVKLNQKDLIFSYRLPTEAQWEYACRAGTNTVYYWGDHWNPYNNATTNPWGIKNILLGGLAEWCMDSYSTYPEMEQVDPAVFSDKADKIFRGGQLGNSPVTSGVPCSRRFHEAPDFKHQALGFRLVRVPKVPKEGSPS